MKNFNQIFCVSKNYLEYHDQIKLKFKKYISIQKLKLVCEKKKKKSGSYKN